MLLPCNLTRQKHSPDLELKPFFEPLTVDEEWTDDVELLRTVLKTAGSNQDGLAYSCLKSLAGSRLRLTNPARFRHREDVQNFLAQAIEEGVVVETGNGATKLLSLPLEGAKHVPTISLSDQAPISGSDIPERVLEMVIVMPFVLFVPWSYCPTGNKFPKGTFVQSSGKWAILLFHTLTGAQRTVAELPWLRFGTLVDWRRAGEVLREPRIAPTAPTIGLVECCRCGEIALSESDMLPEADGNYCPKCFSWKGNEREQAICKVVALLEMMAENDDVYVAENILRKQLCLRYTAECISRKHGDIWIEEAVKEGSVISFKRSGIKTKLVCLPSQV